MIQDLNEQKLNEEDPNADETRKERRLATVQYFERTKGMHNYKYHKVSQSIRPTKYPKVT